MPSLAFSTNFPSFFFACIQIRAVLHGETLFAICIHVFQTINVIEERTIINFNILIFDLIILIFEMNQSLIVQPACIGGSLQGAKQNKLLFHFPFNTTLYTIALRSSLDYVSTRNVNERSSRLMSNMTLESIVRLRPLY